MKFLGFGIIYLLNISKIMRNIPILEPEANLGMWWPVGEMHYDGPFYT